MSLSLQSICSKVVLFGAWGLSSVDDPCALNHRWNQTSKCKKGWNSSKDMRSIPRTQYISSLCYSIPCFTLHDCTPSRNSGNQVLEVYCKYPWPGNKFQLFPFLWNFKTTTHSFPNCSTSSLNPCLQLLRKSQQYGTRAGHRHPCSNTQGTTPKTILHF